MWLSGLALLCTGAVGVSPLSTIQPEPRILCAVIKSISVSRFMTLRKSSGASRVSLNHYLPGIVLMPRQAREERHRGSIIGGTGFSSFMVLAGTSCCLHKS
jgi:hypothetical protein